ncbi:MAG: ligase-associated DNA damage response endonuclease PdeM [Pseudomonadota bacterium]
MSAIIANSKTETLLHVRGEMLKPLAEGALWWAEHGVLIVSDLHLEKGSSFAVRGQMLPPYDTSATLTIVEALMAELAPRMVISLGDSFHDGKAETRMSEACTARVRALTASTDWVWVEGNHDPDPPAHLGGRAAKVLQMGELVFRHEPTGDTGEIAGHLHPCARIAGKHRALRRRCFVTDGCSLVMPALGAFTGGLNVLDEAFDSVFSGSERMVFAMGKEDVFPVRRQRLREDGAGRDTGRWRIKSGG